MTGRQRFLLAALGLALIAAGPQIYPWSRILLLIAMAEGFAVLGILVLLRAGQVSFGHALYFAISAYAVAYMTRWGGDLVVVLPAAILCSLVAGLLVGLFVVRYRYIFFAMLNLAFSMVLYSILEKFFHLTGGSDGLRVPRPLVFGAELGRADFEMVLFYLALGLMALLGWGVYRYLQSPLGRQLGALKSNETRLEYLGISPARSLLVAYVLSAGLAGTGGALLAYLQGLVTPEFAYWTRSGEFVFIAILGGAGSVAGPFAGAIVYEVVKSSAAAYATEYWQLALGTVLLLVILFASRGLSGMAVDLWQRLGRRRPADRGEA